MNYTLHQGDCLDIMPTLPENSVDTIITDPPYGLSFMNKNWDHGVPGEQFWREALRVAKPGAMLLAFGGTRTVHRLACAIEDAGWEIRDRIQWIYGSGYPKSHNISKAIDKAAGAEREVVGVAADFARDGSRRKVDGSHAAPTNQVPNGDRWSQPITAPATDAARTWDGWGTALKPAHEGIIVAMKPRDGTFANNALTHGVAGLWIDGGRVPANGERPTGGGNKSTVQATGKNGGNVTPPAGRWPANVLHDGSDEVLAGFPETTSPKQYTKKKAGWLPPGSIHFKNELQSQEFGDSGSAARFFYCAKASRRERNAGLEGLEELSQMRSDLTEDERQYVMSELQKEGLV